MPIRSAVYSRGDRQRRHHAPRSRFLAGNSTYILTVVGVGPTGLTWTHPAGSLDGEYIGSPGSNFSTPFKPAYMILGRSVPAASRINYRAAELIALRMAEQIALRMAAAMRPAGRR